MDGVRPRPTARWPYEVLILPRPAGCLTWPPWTTRPARRSVTCIWTCCAGSTGSSIRPPPVHRGVAPGAGRRLRRAGGVRPCIFRFPPSAARPASSSTWPGPSWAWAYGSTISCRKTRHGTRRLREGRLTSSIAVNGEDSCELVPGPSIAEGPHPLGSRGIAAPRTWHLPRGVSPARRGSRIIAEVTYPRRLTRAATACPRRSCAYPIYRAIPGAPARPERRDFRTGGIRLNCSSRAARDTSAAWSPPR